MAQQQLANWIRDELQERGWDQAELARRSGITSAQVSRVLSEARGAGLDFYRGVARAFGIPLEVVLRNAGVLPPTYGVEDVRPLFERLSRLPVEWRRFALTSWEGALLVAERAPLEQVPRDNHTGLTARAS